MYVYCICCPRSGPNWKGMSGPHGLLREIPMLPACCLNYGEDNPQVLVTGGVDKNVNTLHDSWILDVKSGRWKEVSNQVHMIVWLVQAQVY